MDWRGEIRHAVLIAPPDVRQRIEAAALAGEFAAVTTSAEPLDRSRRYNIGRYCSYVDIGGLTTRQRRV